MGYHLKCTKCNSKNIKINVEVTLQIAPKFINAITKRGLQNKDIQLICANWPKARIICKDYNYREFL